MAAPSAAAGALTSLLIVLFHASVTAQTPDELLAELLRQPADVRREGERVHFTGLLTDANVASLLKALADGPTRTLRINSGGGDVSASLAAAEHVRAAGLEVEVEHLCASSCANYVFTAAASRRILPGAVVAWHGGADQKDFREYRECGREVSSFSGAKREWTPEAVSASQSNSLREQNLFASLGVSSYITRAGQEPDFSGRNFTYSVDDMAKFGLAQVTAEPGYGTPEFCERMATLRPQLGLLCLSVSPRLLAYEKARLALGETCAADGTLGLRQLVR